MLLLQQCFPDFSVELQRLLTQAGRLGLANQINELTLHDRCRCSDSFCGTFYTAPKPKGSYGSGHENVVLEPDEGIVILDVVDGRIKCVEVLYRDAIRSKLQELLP